MTDILPRCSHGAIILGCEHDDCPEQNKYLDRMSAAIQRYEDDQREAARRIVRDALGLR